ncbi:MAG: MerR family transcriptional regulator [Alphaproteobacteria bacterium]|nr:MerR family transcriptional regulator [Alphaproteobacteria bacterium]
MEKSPEAYKTISEAAEELGVEQHVLRFWETKFPQIKPLKRRGGRRFYRPEDMDALHQIRSLLKEKGFTIKGAKQALSTKSVDAKGAEKSTAAPQLDLLGQPVAAVPAAPAAAAKATGLTAKQRVKLADTLAKLESARNRLQSVA